MGKTDYTNESQQNLIKITHYLATDVTRHTTIGEIAEALELTKSKVQWTLHNLRERGWAEQSGDGWRLGTAIAKISEGIRKAHADSLQRYLGAERFSADPTLAQINKII